MTPQVSVLPAAERDIDGQAEYLFREASLETALRFYDFAAVAFEKLARTPGLGEQRHSSNPLLAGLRIWRIDGFPNHLIFYRPIEGGIEIVRVLHGARDIDAVLESERWRVIATGPSSREGHREVIRFTIRSTNRKNTLGALQESAG
jgi:toxin ParE1/3/4